MAGGNAPAPILLLCHSRKHMSSPHWNPYISQQLNAEAPRRRGRGGCFLGVLCGDVVFRFPLLRTDLSPYWQCTRHAMMIL
jgi:hypothetical protein